MNVDVTKHWKRKPVAKEDFVCRCGDRLNPLILQQAEIQERLAGAREQLRAKELELRPYRETVDSLESRASNISCRLNTWWAEYEGRA